MPPDPSSGPFRAPSGTKDVLPPESAHWEKALVTFAQLAHRANYGLALTPLFEDLGLFTRGIGESTDVVGKEMYDFADKGGRRLALRPEFTASVVRAYVQHRPVAPWKVYYAGPAFRYERPQAGRYRQFYQVGIEVLGSADADLDVEVIALAWDYFRALGLNHVSVRLNSLGDASCRPAYRSGLLAYLMDRRDQLCPEHSERLEANPLRVLDCKKEPCRKASVDAPAQVDHLCDECSKHFARVRDGLDSAQVPAEPDTRLVRGLDYYTRTTFEFVAEDLDVAQNAIGGGGRYDELVQALGGPPTPAIGFSAGLERLMLARRAQGTAAEVVEGLEVFVVDVAGGDAARALTRQLRQAGFHADRAFDGRSLKSQLKSADRSGAKLALIIGPDEIEAGVVTLRSLRHAGAGQQISVGRADLIERVRKELL